MDIATLHDAYHTGATDPLAVCDAFLAARPVGSGVDAFVSVDAEAVRRQARDCAARFADGQARPLEGVLVGVKDFVHVEGYPTRAGTGFLADIARTDAALVTRLRAAGAIIAGKTRMTELGLSPIGVNTADRSPRNPHDPGRITGGSSSGSAAAVASGLVPLAVGSDGGGSLRIPPSLCGAVGLKPTHGRVSVGGVLPTGWWSLDATGPIARTVADVARGYAVMADVPPPDLEAAGTITVGVDWSWWGIPTSAVDEVCRAALDAFTPTEVSVDHLELVQPAAYTTVLAEVAAAMDVHVRDGVDRFSDSVAFQLALASSLTAVDYVRAQQARTLLADSLAETLASVDVLVTPTTATAAVALDDDEWHVDRADEALIAQLTRYTFPANLAGLPALSVPVGTTRDGLPVGLQLLAGRGREDVLLRLAARLEQDGVVRTLRPRIWHDAIAAPT